jgi:hypothetical protein
MKSNNLKYIPWSSIFYAKLVFTKRGRLLKMIYQLDVVHNWAKPSKLLQTLLNEKLL